MKVYQYDLDGKYTGELILDSSDKSPSGSWNIPAFCTEQLPKTKDGYTPYFKNDKWALVKDEVKEEEKEYVPTLEDKISTLDNEYEYSKKELLSCFVEAMLAGDTETQDAVKEELHALSISYDEEREVLVNGTI